MLPSSPHAHGGELIEMLPAEQAEMLKTIASVDADVSAKNLALAHAYGIVTAAALRGAPVATQ